MENTTREKLILPKQSAEELLAISSKLNAMCKDDAVITTNDLIALKAYAEKVKPDDSQGSIPEELEMNYYAAQRCIELIDEYFGLPLEFFGHYVPKLEEVRNKIHQFALANSPIE